MLFNTFPLTLESCGLHQTFWEAYLMPLISIPIVNRKKLNSIFFFVVKIVAYFQKTT